MAQKYEIKKAARARFIYKALQNETLVKRNVNCKKYTANINLYDKAWIFLKKNLKKKNNNHAPWCRRCAVATHQAFFIFGKPAIQNPFIQPRVF